MNAPDGPLHKALERDLEALRLTRIAETYQEILKTAARKGSSMLEVLALLVAEEAAALRERALLRRIRKAKLPKRKTLEEYDFSFPKRIPKQAILRLFDGDFVERHECGVFIGPRGTGKTHLLVALGYRACELGISVRFTRVVDMLNDLVTAQMNGTLARALREYVRPALLLADEVGYIPIDKRGADLMFQVVAARYEAGSIVLSTNRPFKQWGTIFDADTTLATAMIDRLMHHGDAYVIRGDSYRMKDKEQDDDDEAAGSLVPA
jgi:DNA replication protein DnaC